MPVYNLNQADENLIEEILDPKELEPRIPWHQTHVEGVAEMRDVMAQMSTLGKFTKETGYTPCRTWQRIASIPWPVAVAIKEIDPLYFRDPVKVGRFLRRHPEYAVVTKVG